MELSGERMIGVEAVGNGVFSLVMEGKDSAGTCSPSFAAALRGFLGGIPELRPKVLVLRGTPELFSAGASLAELLDLCEGRQEVRRVPVPELLLDIPCPVIAAMEGHALGGGLMIGVCCDMVVMARESRYGATFMARGLTPGMGCTALLAELVGPFLAAEMMFTGRNFRGSELATRGTNINYIEKRGDVLPRAMELASRLAEMELDTLMLLKGTLAARKKRLLAEARNQEHLMHAAIFANPATKRTIKERYPA